MTYVRGVSQDFERALAEEREREINATTEQISAVNEVFNELGQLVAQQQDFVDGVERNIDSAASRTADANRSSNAQARACAYYN